MSARISRCGRVVNKGRYVSGGSFVMYARISHGRWVCVVVGIRIAIKGRARMHYSNIDYIIYGWQY